MDLRTARFVFGILGVFLVAALLNNPASARVKAKDVTITKDNQTATLDCDGSTVTVRGHDNKLTIKGECKKVAVSGDDNNLSISIVKDLEVSGDDNNISVDSIEKIIIGGDDNNVLWKTGPKGNAPLISSKGNDNKIRHVGN
jgi:Protein of unknown function (DUF3060)